MANIKITDLTAYTNPVSTDVLPIVDVGADVTKKVSIADLLENAGSGTAAAPGIAFDGDSDTGIYHPGADQVAISTNGTERARIDGSGRLLVGTSSSSSNSIAVFQGGSTGSTGAGRLDIARGQTFTSSNINIGFIDFTDSNNNLFGQINCASDATVTPGSDHPGRLVFSTTADGASSPTERMRITSTGQTYWDTSAPTSSSFGTSIGRSVLGLFETYRDGTAAQAVARMGGTVGEAFVFCDGDLENTNNSYAGISDIKLKENIVDANSQWNDLKALQVRNYNFKAETGYSTHTQIGLIAQEVELVSPGLVGTSIDDETGESTKNVNYSVLYMKAVKALQEAMERIEVLEAKVNALEGN